MQISQHSSASASSLERRIDMSVPLSEIEKEVEERLKKLARTVRMAGFRPGKVPIKIVAKQYGPQVRSEAVSDAVQKVFDGVVRERNLRVAGFPRIEPKQPGDAAQLEFVAVFEVYPEIKLGDISASEIVRPSLAVGDAEVDHTIEVLRKQRKTYSEAQRAAEDGDRVVVDFTGRIGGEVFQGGQATDFPFVVGAGTMLAEFESQIKGMRAGADKAFDLVFPADYHAKDLAENTARFDVVVKRVEAAQVPQVDAEFAKALGIADGDLTKMRSEVKANLEREVKKRIGARVKDQVMNALLEANPIEVPKAVVDMEARQLAENARQDLESRGVNTQSTPVDPAWFAEQAQRRVKLGLILAELVRDKGLKAKPEQIRGFIEDLAQSYDDPAEVTRWYHSQPKRLAEAEAVVIEENVVRWVLENARVSDSAIGFDELMGSTA